VLNAHRLKCTVADMKGDFAIARLGRRTGRQAQA
jgi:hypothetical protein